MNQSNYSNNEQYYSATVTTQQIQKKHIGTVENRDYLVVQRTKGLDISEAERQQHFEELVQDNRRMREVLEQLQREVDSYKKNSSTDVVVMRKEMAATQQELDEAQRQILLLQSQYEEKYKLEIEKLRKEIEEWISKYRDIEQREKANAAALQELNFYKGRVSMYETEAKKRFQQVNSAESTQRKYDEQIQMTQSLTFELSEWKQKYESLLLEFRELQSSMKQKDSYLIYEQQIEDLLQEIKNWKARCIQLEEQFEHYYGNKDLKIEIEKLKQLLLQKDQQLSQWEVKVDQMGRSTMTIQNYQQQAADYEDRLRKLQAECDYANRKLQDQEKEMGELRIMGSVFTQDKFDEMQESIWKLEGDIEQLTKDNDTFMEQINILEQQLEEITIKYNEQNVKYLEMKETIESNSSKYMTVSNLKKEISTLQNDLEVWKNRYFQTEIRLKEYDKLKTEYEELILMSKTSTTWQIEKERLLKQIKQYETQVEEIRTTRTTTLSADVEQKLYNLQNQLNELRSKLQSANQEKERLSRQIQDYESQFRQMKNTTTTTKTYYSEDSGKIRELNELLKLKNKQILELETQLKEGSVIIIREQVRVKETRIKELESQTETLQLEIQRLQNIIKEQEIRIQLLIEKNTEFESNNNMLNQQLTRMSRKPTARVESRQASSIQQQQQSNQVITTTKYVTMSKGIYPTEHENSEILDRIENEESKYIRSSQQQPQIVISQYKTTQL